MMFANTDTRAGLTRPASSCSSVVRVYCHGMLTDAYPMIRTGWLICSGCGARIGNVPTVPARPGSRRAPSRPGRNA